MEFKGTKGKWYLQEFTDVYTNIVRCDNGKGNETLWICNLHGESAENRNRYNAQLISKAPEMLEMLKKCTEILGDAPLGSEMTEWVSEANKLIKEATTI